MNESGARVDSPLTTLVRISQWWRATTVDAPPRRPADSDLKRGSKWGDFTIVEKLGAGSFGCVYYARDRLERDVALKLLDSPEAIHEGKILARIRHPNIVQVYSYESGVQGSALVMELIRGQNLERFVEKNGKFDAINAALTGATLCRAMAMVHSKGLVHRDIKASNVIRQPDGRVILVDFGLGRVISPEGGTPQVAGTVLYMAPEIFEGSPASTKTDIYALGVLLFHLLSLNYPVVAQDYRGFRDAHRKGICTSLLDLRPDVPPALIQAVETAIHPDPAKRFRSAGMMASALEEVWQAGRRRANRRAWSIALAAVAVAGCGIAWQLLHNRPSEAPLQFMRLTNTDTLSQEPSLSADGSLMVYDSDEAGGGNLDIWIRKIPGGAAMRLTHDPTNHTTPAISSDGQWVVFRSEKNGGGIYVIPAFGGPERLIAAGGYAPRISPDGKYVTYYVGDPWHSRYPGAKLYVAPLTGGEAQQKASDLADARNPVWAPDSRHILIQGSNDPKVPPDTNAEWWVASLDGSGSINTGALHKFREQGLEVHTWAAYWGKNAIVFSASHGANVNLWTANISLEPALRSSSAERLTSGTGFEASPWVSDSGTLAFDNVEQRLHIWSINLNHGGRGREVAMSKITSARDLDAMPSVSHDGKLLAFTRSTSEKGTRQAWVRNLSSGEETMLTDTPDWKGAVVLNPDGQRLAYSAQQGDDTDIIEINKETRGSRRICHKCGWIASWTPDGKALVTSTGDAINRVDAETGALQPILSRSGFLVDEAELSPDQRWILFSVHRPSQLRQVYLASITKPGEWIRLANESAWSDKGHWSRDGKTIYYYAFSDGHACIWSRTFSSTTGLVSDEPKVVTHFHDVRQSPLQVSQAARGFAVGPDKMYFNLAEMSGSIWLGFRQK